MISHLYRFRPIGAVLDKYEELAKQEIYFSPCAARRDGLARNGGMREGGG
jgi:hypothetical protein